MRRVCRIDEKYVFIALEGILDVNAKELLFGSKALEFVGRNHEKVPLLKYLERQDIILDVGDVTQCDGHGLQIILELLKAAQATGNSLTMVNRSEAVIRALNTRDLGQYFPVQQLTT